ncbi:putative Metallophosphoesterase [Candidatus Sulfobium mesophilum]|uniref:Putative Metallophosphoesterase n=1 Tax=Candidatus Sulfobium mesophilum TaxID=2016548 RepID=A0A2U3QHN3_9BACT|nr:putative Metallophosphoesterase [Candidatus Sulfobium mesophilum]
MERKQKQRKVWVHLTKTCLIALATIFLAAVLSNGETSRKFETLNKIQGRFSFVVIGDTRSGGNDYSELVKRVMQYKPDFMVNTGDMVSSPSRSRWNDFWEKSKPVAVPYFLTVGNHDVNDKKSEELYKEEVDLPGNKLYYSFTVDDALFIFLDSNIPGQDRKIAGDQYKWLEKVLSSSYHKYKFVFVHHPLFPEKGTGYHYGGSLDRYPQERDRLESLLEKSNVSIVFTGHEHLYLRKIVNGVMHVITGGGGALLYTNEEKGGFYHFILVTVDGDTVKGEVIDINGKVKDAFRR